MLLLPACQLGGRAWKPNLLMPSMALVITRLRFEPAQRAGTERAQDLLKYVAKMFVSCLMALRILVRGCSRPRQSHRAWTARPAASRNNVVRILAYRG